MLFSYLITRLVCIFPCPNASINSFVEVLKYLGRVVSKSMHWFEKPGPIIASGNQERYRKYLRNRRSGTRCHLIKLSFCHHFHLKILQLPIEYAPILAAIYFFCSRRCRLTKKQLHRPRSTHIYASTFSDSFL